MAFILTLDPEEQSATFDLRGSDVIVVVPIGYDDSRPITYSLALGFSPLAGGDLEFVFYVVEADDEDDTEHELWSGRQTAQIFGSEDRAAILGALLRATEMLVNAVRPASFTMCTIDTGGSEKARRKHLLVVRVFEMCGYDVESGDEFHGELMWRMERHP